MNSLVPFRSVPPGQIELRHALDRSVPVMNVRESAKCNAAMQQIANPKCKIRARFEGRGYKSVSCMLHEVPGARYLVCTKVCTNEKRS